MFCSADIASNVLNTFFQQGVRIIDTFDLDSLQSAQTRDPITLSFNSRILHRTPQAIKSTVKSQLTGRGLDCVIFIILDAHSIEGGTCILADNQDEEVGLRLVRSDFWAALATLNALTCTSLKLETVVETVAGTDSVYRERRAGKEGLGRQRAWYSELDRAH